MKKAMWSGLLIELIMLMLIILLIIINKPIPDLVYVIFMGGLLLSLISSCFAKRENLE